MLELFLARSARARAQGGHRAQFRLWGECFRDLATTACPERLEQWGFKKVRRAALRGITRHRFTQGRAPSIEPNIFVGSRGLFVESVLQDIKHSVRLLAKSPGFTSIAILIVALGIGANTAMFSVVDSFLFRPIPWDRPEELVWIYQDSDDGQPNSNSYPAYRDIAQHTDVFSGVMAMINARTARYLTDADESQQVTVSFVTSGYMGVLGLAPSRGRWFEQLHDVPGGEPVAVVSFRSWQKLFGGAADILGKPVRLNGATVTVIGVGPEGYTGVLPGVDNDFWLSISSAGPVGGNFYWSTLERRQDHWFLSIGRLQPGVSAQQAQAAMNILAQRLATNYPDLNANRDITVFPASSVRQHPDEDAALFAGGAMLMGVVGMVLLIACGNLANLLLARASTRGREVAIRLAVGSTRGRLVRHLLTESVILSTAGGFAGLFFAFVGGRLLVANQPPLPLPVTLEVNLDIRVLIFAMCLSVLTGLVFGLAPALRASRPDLVSSLKDANEAFNIGKRPSRRLRWLGLRNVLVIIQVAVSMVLLVAAGLLVRSLMNAQDVDLGYAVDGIAVLQADVREAGYEGDAGTQIFTELRRRVEGLPGVEAVGMTTRLPTSASGGSSTLEIEDYQPVTGTGEVEVIYGYIDTEYLDTFKMPVLYGRGFAESDRSDSERVALINEAFALRYFGSSDAVGRRYRHQGIPDSWVRVVGVVGDFKVRTPAELPTPMFFRPLAQYSGTPRLYLVARTAGDPSETVGMMRRELRAIDSDVPVYQAGTMSDHISQALALPRAAAGMLGVFGGLALLLASLGLYAVVAFVVSRRSAEMGIRIALGASGGSVFGLVVREMMVVVGIGVVIGLGLSWLATPILESLLFNIVPSDPLTFAIVAVLLAVVALLATWLPARRAARVDPMSALRFE
jgi:macrolide transport system ATP-binding/permease protein